MIKHMFFFNCYHKCILCNICMIHDRGHINDVPLTSVVKFNCCSVIAANILHESLSSMAVIYITYIHWISTRGQCVQCIQSDVTGFIRATNHTKRNDKESVCVQIRRVKHLEIWSLPWCEADFFLFFFLFFPILHIIFWHCFWYLIMMIYY